MATKRKAKARAKKEANNKPRRMRKPKAEEPRLKPQTAAEAGITCRCGAPAEYYNTEHGYVCGTHNAGRPGVKLAIRETDTRAVA